LSSKNVLDETALNIALKRNCIDVSCIISRKIQADRVKSLFGKIQKKTGVSRVVKDAAICDIPERSGHVLKRSSPAESVHAIGAIPGGWLQVSENGKAFGWIHHQSVVGAAATMEGAGARRKAAGMGEWRFMGLEFYLRGHGAYYDESAIAERSKKHMRCISRRGKIHRRSHRRRPKKRHCHCDALEIEPRGNVFRVGLGVKVRSGMRVHGIGFPVETGISIVSGDVASINGF